AGLPREAGGCFVSGGSAGNLAALVAAREAAGGKEGRCFDPLPQCGRLLVDLRELRFRQQFAEEIEIIRDK
ncbi:MAG: hypothetical protein SYC29_15060, partial [Planctomycetota bacterium]|nr:hypothetical protein [Planctomycetota bacterium]